MHVQLMNYVCSFVRYYSSASSALGALNDNVLCNSTHSLSCSSCSQTCDLVITRGVRFTYGVADVDVDAVVEVLEHFVDVAGSGGTQEPRPAVRLTATSQHRRRDSTRFQRQPPPPQQLRVKYKVNYTGIAVRSVNLPYRYWNSHAICDHTVITHTRHTCR